MRLSEIGRLVARRGATSYMQKRGFAIPASLAVGAMLPGQIADAVQRYEDITESLNRAAGEPLDASVATKQAGMFGNVMRGATGVKPPANARPAQLGGQFGGQLISSLLKPIISAPGEGIAERIKGVFGPKPPGVLQTMQNTAVETLGKSLGEAGADLVKDIASKAIASVGAVGANAARTAIVQGLMADDPILAEADEAKLMEAYHTMVRFAPVLSTDKNAVRSFLRQAVMTGAGPDYAAIKLLADSERAVTGGGQ